MDPPKHKEAVEDDLSDAASSLAEERTLNDEPLPSYDEESASVNERLPSEKTISPSHIGNIPEQTGRAQIPTATDPFAFPSQSPYQETPSYQNKSAIYRPLAIPQIAPSAAAPFLLAYPTALLSFGITSESWRAFVETVSAFLSAKVSQQAIHHAADIASNIGDYHKQYALRAKEGFKNIGKAAKRFSPVGVVGSTIGVTLGSVGHIVDTVFQAAGSLRLKPQTPRERAAAYVETANQDWFHSRSLHAALMDTSELSRLCQVEKHEMLSAAHTCESSSPESQLSALQDIIGEVKVEEAVQPSTTSKESSVSSSKSAGKRSVAQRLHLGGTTLWVVLVQSQDYVPLNRTSPS